MELHKLWAFGTKISLGELVYSDTNIYAWARIWICSHDIGIDRSVVKTMVPW